MDRKLKKENSCSSAAVELHYKYVLIVCKQTANQTWSNNLLFKESDFSLLLYYYNTI